MLRFLQLEWYKIRTNRAFWVILLLNLLAFVGFLQVIANSYRSVTHTKEENGKLEVLRPFFEKPFNYPEIWQTSAFFLSFLVPLSAILVILNINNEWSSKMLRQHIIEGLSRKEFLLSKFIWLLVLTLVFTFFYVLANLFVGSGEWEISNTIFYFALLVFAQLSIAFALGLWIKRSVLAVTIFIAYMLIAEPLLIWFLKKYSLDFLVPFLPFEVSDRLILPPEVFKFFSPKITSKEVKPFKHKCFTQYLKAPCFGYLRFGNLRKKICKSDIFLPIALVIFKNVVSKSFQRAIIGSSLIYLRKFSDKLLQVGV
jgi:ABC-2 type transport system permease protein